MAYQTAEKIVETLEAITNRSLVLPAIQREFVWQPDQICRLFDSIMQGFPFGTFLYWNVDAGHSGDFQFYDFALDYHQRARFHNDALPNMPRRSVTAVLDGQQRLTALNIGLRGSMSLKLPRLRWSNPNAFPVKKLHLNLLWRPDENIEDELSHEFDFLTSEEAALKDERTCWFPASSIMSWGGESHEIANWLNDQQLRSEEFRLANRTLHRLYEVVHSEQLVVHYKEDSQNLDRVLQLFIRMNNGGTPLSNSDLLLSIAVAQWQHLDAREEIHDLVDDLNRIGSRFSFSKDLVLKASLMLSDRGSVGFKVVNFNRENMSVVEANWEHIRSALTLTVRLVSDFGFDDRNLNAPNAILPIAYYLYRKSPGERFLTHNEFNRDRQMIREWLIRSLLKSGIWSGGAADGILTRIRQIIRDESDSGKFPVESVYREMASRGRSLSFEEEEIEDLADMQYSNRLTFALLSLLFPAINMNTHHFHVDHVFPKARFNRRQLRSAGVSNEKIDSFIEARDGLANLQLLAGAINQEKSSKMPAEWIEEAFPNEANRQEYVNNHLLGEITESITEFDAFYEARRERLKVRITELLGRQTIAGAPV